MTAKQDQTDEPMTPVDGGPEQEPDPAEVIGGPGDADATPEELAAAAAPPVVPDPYEGLEPEQWGYCHTSDCVVNAQQLWHPVGQPGPDNAADEFGRPHQCADLSHPHPVMCQCGNLLQADPVEGQPQAADTLVKEDA